MCPSPIPGTHGRKRSVPEQIHSTEAADRFGVGAHEVKAWNVSHVTAHPFRRAKKHPGWCTFRPAELAHFSTGLDIGETGPPFEDGALAERVGRGPQNLGYPVVLFYELLGQVVGLGRGCNEGR